VRTELLIGQVGRALLLRPSNPPCAAPGRRAARTRPQSLAVAAPRAGRSKRPHHAQAGLGVTSRTRAGLPDHRCALTSAPSRAGASRWPKQTVVPRAGWLEQAPRTRQRRPSTLRGHTVRRLARRHVE
jgi:hypothetical protein